MNKYLIVVALAAFIWACGGNPDSNGDDKAPPPKSMVKEEPKADPKGIGEVKEVKLNSPLNADMVAKGKALYELKCAACHKLSDQRVVGPGWKAITTKRTPEWIMNMTVNVEEMLEKDPEGEKDAEGMSGTYAESKPFGCGCTGCAGVYVCE